MNPRVVLFDVEEDAGSGADSDRSGNEAGWCLQSGSIPRIPGHAM